MRQTIIILILFLGVVGGGYFVLNPGGVYDNAAAVEMREIVIDDGESTVTRKFSRDVMNERSEIEIETDTEKSLLEEATTTEADNPTPIAVPVEDEETQDQSIDLSEDEKMRTLVLRDGFVSTEPKKDHVFLCEETATSESTLRKPWIQRDLWYPNLKLKAEGEVYRKNANFIVEVNNEVRTLAGNTLPDHATGAFPVDSSSRVFPYTTERSSITTHLLGITLPANPEKADAPTCVPKGRIGIMLSGASLYSAVTPQGLDAGAHALEDMCGGSPDANGMYRYHRESPCIVEEGHEGPASLLGYALDGFGIYGSVENGQKITNDDLDSCHGHTHEIEWDGELRNMYHYHATDEYPYTIGCFVGSPVPN